LNVLSFDPITGEAKQIGENIPLALDSSNGAAVDPINGIYYVAVANLTNGHATVVGINLKSGGVVRSVDISGFASGLYAMLGAISHLLFRRDFLSYSYTCSLQEPSCSLTLTLVYVCVLPCQPTTSYSFSVSIIDSLRLRLGSHSYLVQNFVHRSI
jgi:hypothetical protein